MQLPESIKQILDDNLSGSVTLLKRLMVALENELLNPETNDTVFIGYIEAIRSKMEMFTVIRHFCDELILSHNISSSQYPNNYFEFINEYKDFWERVPQQLLNNLQKVDDIKDKTVMLHSNSGTIREVFRLFAEESARVNIFQTLSAPAEEGRIQAHDLANMGYDVTLIADALSAEKMKQTQMLILGADQIRQRTIINKTGSLQMVLAAQEFNVPVVVLTESRKLLDFKDDERAFRDKKRNPDEVLKEIRHPHLTAENLYFEEIPKYYINHIITEKSVMDADDI
ncbi:MAG TPA: hypothetical protein VJ951_01800 [Bacteroidales bacterium]|nr:hypothetical protein [Bacteroidales bacterium]